MSGVSVAEYRKKGVNAMKTGWGEICGVFPAGAHPGGKTAPTELHETGGEGAPGSSRPSHLTTRELYVTFYSNE